MELGGLEIEHGPVILGKLCLGGQLIGPTHEALDFGHQDHAVKGLGNIIVCPHIDGHNDFGSLVMRGQEENRDIGDFADFLAPVVAVKEG